MVNLAGITSHDAATAAPQRSSGSGLVIAGDRSREFGRANRHSIAIRVLRIGLPIVGVAISALYVWTMLDTAGYGRAPSPPTISATLDKEITMDNPKYEGFSKDGGTYTLTSKTAIPDLTNPSLVKLNEITGVMFDARKSRTDMTAVHGLFDNKANRLDLSDGIDVITQTGMHAKLQTATMMTKEGTLVSRTPVEIDMPSGTVTSNAMSLNQKTHDVTFLDAVKAHLVPQAKPDAAASVNVMPPPTGLPAHAFGQSSAPVDVTSDRLDVHDASKTAKFSGRVHAVQSAATLDTEALDIAYDGGNPTGATAGLADPAQPAAKIKHITAPLPVVMTQASGERVSGESADFDAAEETAIVTGNVVMTAGPDRRATAARVEFKQKPDTFLLTGNVVVTQARNELRGRNLFVDRKSGKTELTSPADGASPKSRIFARLYQGDGKPGPPAKTAPDPGAAATGITNFKTDPNAPVDIEADKLNADDTRKVAIFTGDVKAAQGDFIIRTPELVASYNGDAGLANMGAPGSAAAAGVPAKAPAQLTRIEARGKVIVTSKVGQEVTGDTAVFDTKANTVLISGKEVILTQDKNVVRCNKIKIEMATGQSNCQWESVVGDSASAAIAAATGASPAPTSGTKAARPSVLFYPEEHGKPGSAPKPAAAAAKPSSSSWESSVAPNTN